MTPQQFYDKWFKTMNCQEMADNIHISYDMKEDFLEMINGLYILINPVDQTSLDAFFDEVKIKESQWK